LAKLLSFLNKTPAMPPTRAKAIEAFKNMDPCPRCYMAQVMMVYVPWAFYVTKILTH